MRKMAILSLKISPRARHWAYYIKLYSHRQWDSEEALAIRMQYNGKLPSDSINSGVKVAPSAGDLLVFSANMLHRSIYGLERMALDILLCDPEPALLKFAPSDCLPSQKI